MKPASEVTGFDLRPQRGQLLADHGGAVSGARCPNLADTDVVFVMVMTGAQVMAVVAGAGMG